MIAVNERRLVRRKSMMYRDQRVAMAQQRRGAQHFDPGFSDHEEGRAVSAENPFVAKMSLGHGYTHLTL
jgi:hypothetical protein